MSGLDHLIDIFGARGDLAHMALFLWASGASGLLAWALKQLVAANRRFDAFVNEIAHLNALFHERKSDD